MEIITGWGASDIMLGQLNQGHKEQEFSNILTGNPQ
jgi:hypothetical protein